MQVKSFISQWSNNYRLIFQKSRLISQIPIFIIAVMAICQIVWTLDIWTKYPEASFDIIAKDLLFHFSIAGLFLFRFILLFFNSKLLFWFAQAIWLTYFIGLRLSADSAVYCTKNIFPTSEGVSIILAIYMLGSCLRQLLSLACAFFLKEESLEINR